MKTYHKNPRRITDSQLEALADSLHDLGDLSGIVHDLNSDEVISGNQRSKVFDINDCEIVLEHEQEPDEQGTVGLGYVIWQGNRYGYRQVRWTPKQCEAANIKANRLGGDWDWDKLTEFDLGDLLEWGFSEPELGSGYELDTDFTPDESDAKGFRQMVFVLLPDQLETVEGVLDAIVEQGVEYPGNEHLLSNALYFLACSHNGT